MDYQGRIVSEPKIRSRKPTISGTRITVGDVLEYLAAGNTQEKILAEFPQLKLEDILACLAFAGNRER